MFEDTVTVSITCDLCGRESQRPDGWGKDAFDVRSVTIEAVEGYSFPEGGDYETTGYDLCPDCFWSRLVPWMDGQGAVPTVRQE
jgi:hypothetical protein